MPKKSSGEVWVIVVLEGFEEKGGLTEYRGRYTQRGGSRKKIKRCG
jgi:hypothetical protein